MFCISRNLPASFTRHYIDYYVKAQRSKSRTTQDYPEVTLYCRHYRAICIQTHTIY